MPPVNISLHQTTSVTAVDDGAVYSVTSVVENASGIDPALFVFKTDTQRFDHYATLADLANVPTSLDVAVVERLSFYRQSRLTRAWPTLRLMQDDLMVTRARLTRVVREASFSQDSAVIDEVLEISAG